MEYAVKYAVQTFLIALIESFINALVEKLCPAIQDGATKIFYASLYKLYKPCLKNLMV